MLRWDRYEYDKIAPIHITLNLYVCIQWELQVMYYISVRPGSEASMHYFSCSGGLGTVSLKTRRDTLRRYFVFATGGMCGSCSAFC
jgi:hypothetical protein